jgi:biopolymer transport protein ExbB
MREVFFETVEYLGQGGWVMIPIIIGSIYMWILIVGRFLTFRDLKGRDITIQEAVRIVRGDDLSGVDNGMRAHLMRQFVSERSGIPDVDVDVLRQSVIRVEMGLNTHLSAIAVLASIAPLLGLLGTVLGMIETFDVISVFGTGNAKAMANGVSVALVSTQTGLLVAIPGMFMSGILNRQSERLKTQLEEDTTILRRAIRSMSNGKDEG